MYTYCHTLSLHYALPICVLARYATCPTLRAFCTVRRCVSLPHSHSWAFHKTVTFMGFPRHISIALHWYGVNSCNSTPCATVRSEEHTSELQSLMRTSYAVFCLNNKHITTPLTHYH